MPCPGPGSHVYMLYLLGLADEPERSDLRFHLKRECETCIRTLAEALEFWFAFACYLDSLDENMDVFPSEDLRDRILDSIPQSALPELSDPPFPRNGRSLTHQLAHFSAHLELIDARSRLGRTEPHPASSTPIPIEERKR